MLRCTTTSPHLLSGSPVTERRPSIFDLYGNQRADHQFDAWVVEASDPLLRLAQGFDGWTGLSFERMVDLRQALMSDVNELVTQEKIPGPRQLGERLQKMNPGALRRAAGRDPVMQDFLQSVLLNGNGTLLINNTFVEWASLQAIRRARPSVLLASFGIRNKVKPVQQPADLFRPRGDQPDSDAGRHAGFIRRLGSVLSVHLAGMRKVRRVPSQHGVSLHRHRNGRPLCNRATGLPTGGL